MKITKLRIKNYRSIRTEAQIDFNDSLTIIGPNNSGKTNFLRAVQLFFEAGRKNTYRIDEDLPFGVSNEQTSITVSFSFSEENDGEFLKKYRVLLDLLEDDKADMTVAINLYLSFSSTGRPNYRFFTNEKIKPDHREDFRRQHEELILEFLDGFSCKYVPSEKNAAQLFSEYFLPHLKNHIGELLQDQEKKVQQALGTIAQSIVKNLTNAGISNISCEFSLPNNLFSAALSNFDFHIDDGEKTHFHRKGSGIQAATTLACFDWISHQELHKGKSVIWLIEEPESYLHPALTDSCKKIIENLSKRSDVLATTHAIGFVPTNHKKVLQTEFAHASGTTFRSLGGYAEATQTLRSALGVRFSDYYGLTEFNVFVEGKTDKLILEHVLSILKPINKSNLYPALRQASFMDFSGVSSLKDFLKATYSFMSKERSIVVIFDGDDAGLKAARDLGGYLNNKKIPFSSNKQYILLPNRLPVEALFPESWLQDLSIDHPSWLTIQRDVSEKIVGLEIKDERKKDAAEWLIERSSAETKKKNGVYDWASKFIQVFKTLEDRLVENVPN